MVAAIRLLGCSCLIEKVPARRKWASNLTFSFGQSLSSLKGWLTGLQVPYLIYSRPQEWQKANEVLGVAVTRT